MRARLALAACLLVVLSACSGADPATDKSPEPEMSASDGSDTDATSPEDAAPPEAVDPNDELARLLALQDARSWTVTYEIDGDAVVVTHEAGGFSAIKFDQDSVLVETAAGVQQCTGGECQPAQGGQAMFDGLRQTVLGAFGGMFTALASSGDGAGFNLDLEDRVIAGREARCVIFDPTFLASFMSDLDGSEQIHACVDKATGVALEMTITKQGETNGTLATAFVETEDRAMLAAGDG